MKSINNDGFLYSDQLKESFKCLYFLAVNTAFLGAEYKVLRKATQKYMQFVIFTISKLALKKIIKLQKLSAHLRNS